MARTSGKENGRDSILFLWDKVRLWKFKGIEGFRLKNI